VFKPGMLSRPGEEEAKAKAEAYAYEAELNCFQSKRQLVNRKLYFALLIYFRIYDRRSKSSSQKCSLFTSTLCCKNVYQPTTNDNFKSSCPIL